MPAGLRRVLRLLRLALVVLALAWTTAPAASAQVTDAIVLVVAAAQRPLPSAGPAVPARPARRASARVRVEVRAPRAAAHRPPARRLFLELRVLLC